MYLPSLNIFISIIVIIITEGTYHVCIKLIHVVYKE